MIQLVLADVLGSSDALQEEPGIPAALTEVVGEHSATVRPDFAFHAEPDDEPMDEPDVDDEPDDDTAARRGFKTLRPRQPSYLTTRGGFSGCGCRGAVIR